jgi:predicted Zn-dependent protease
MGMSMAQAGIIRDGEIESDLRVFANPIFESAGLNPSQVRIILIGDDTVNAFVAEGQNLFLYSGMILETKNVAQLGGVIAHESGHMAGGHLIRMRTEAERASMESMVTAIAGMAIGVGAGNADAGMATALGGGEFANRNLLRNSRTFESSADASGMATLERMGLSAQGMADFLEHLSGEEALPEMQRSQYLLTHPLSRERLDAVNAFLAKSRYKDKRWPSEWEEKYQRIQAKILAFTQPSRAEIQYANDKSFVGQYAKAIAAYRLGRISEALTKISALEKQEPDNPWLYDLRGQIDFEQGNIPESIIAYQKAVNLSPKTGLLHLALAQSMLQQEQAPTKDALAHLVKAREMGERDNPMVYRWMAVGYGRGGNEGQAKLSLAEEALLKGDYGFATSQATQAKKILANDPGAQQRASDIIADAGRARKNKKDD